MEGAEEDREKNNISLRVNGFSRDLLHKFMNQNHFPHENEQLEEKDGEIELSLGLSMNGRFGVDPTRKKMRRSSSISNFFLTVGAVDNGSSLQERGSSHQARVDDETSLGRTCSLPTQTEEWRRRKVLQSTRSMEARKKRMEKLKNVRLVKDKENCSEDGNNGHGVHDVVNRNDNVQMIDNGCLNMVEKVYVMPPSQGSIGSQRSGSSGISDIQSQHTEGAKQIAEVKSPSSIKSQREHGEQKHTIGPAERDAQGANFLLKNAMLDMPYGEQKHTIGPAERDAQGANLLLKNAMLDMPFVSTKGDECNGNKIDGFLYRYRKGEEVRIVCVCHGMFLSPAEFVKHGGGGDVEHPLKHIVVNPSPFL